MCAQLKQVTDFEKNELNLLRNCITSVKGLIGDALEKSDVIHDGVSEQWGQPSKAEDNSGGRRDEPPKVEEDSIIQISKLVVSKGGLHIRLR